MLARLICTAFLALCPVFAFAQQSKVSQVTFLDGWRMENGRHMGAVQIELAPGWKTYWRTPGPNGIPPEFDWTGSENIASVRVHWPRPQVFENYGTRSIGYVDTVVMPIEFTPKDREKPISVQLGVFYGVCEDICIPAQASVAGFLPIGPGSGHQVINAALADMPQTANESGILSVTCAIRPTDKGVTVAAEVQFSGEVGATPLTVFETPSDQVWFTEATTEVSGKRLRAQALLQSYAKDTAIAIDRDAIRLTLLGAERAVDISGCPSG